jgi:hypothetical protein
MWLCHEMTQMPFWQRHEMNEVNFSWYTRQDSGFAFSVQAYSMQASA